MMKIVELTRENEEQYLHQIVELEQIVLEGIKQEGREGQLFATGKEGISEYINSDESRQVQATTYLTQGQNPFTYNDITKYFKYGEKYKQYVKSQYSSEEKYQKDLCRIYTIKVKAFEYATKKILLKHPEIQDIQTFLSQEIQNNGFDEKSELREKINKYMSEYIIQNFGEEVLKKYEQFYWITASDIFLETGRQCNTKSEDVSEYENFVQAQLDYEAILKNGQLIIHEQPEFDEIRYYSANTRNTIELDTYITSPKIRSAGAARILVFEGIKKHIDRHFRNPENKEIFLCSTLHRDNLPSRYVSEFFGLTDSLYVNRRQGRNREVHICKIEREQVMEYLTAISDKLAVLYGYNPNGKHISTKTKRKVLEEQLKYEKGELDRLIKARKIGKKFNGVNIRFIDGKLQKIRKLKKEIVETKETDKGVQ